MSGTLVAVLLNPPDATSGTRTRNAIARAGRVLGYADVQIVNLFPEATRSVVELNLTDVAAERWHAARAETTAMLQMSSGLLGAWGISGMTGKGRLARESRVGWLSTTAIEMGITHIWMVGGQPRHPSRWHQYVADRHDRTSGGSFDGRLREVFESVPVSSLSFASARTS